MSRSVKRFSKDESEFIRANAATMTTKEMAASLNRNHSSVTCHLRSIQVPNFPTLEGEIWKLSVVDRQYSYYVSNLGRICRDMWRLVVPGKSKLVPGKNNTQYYQYGVLKNGTKTSIKLHREIARLFIREPLPNEQVNHINGNGLDNRLENLEWVTASQNLEHSIDSGLRKSKGLNLKFVSEIRDLCLTPTQAKKYLLDKYEVSANYSAIRAAVAGRNWNRNRSSTMPEGSTSK